MNLGVKGLETVAQVPDLIDILYNKGYSKEDIEKKYPIKTFIE